MMIEAGHWFTIPGCYNTIAATLTKKNSGVGPIMCRPVPYAFIVFKAASYLQKHSSLLSFWAHVAAPLFRFVLQFRSDSDFADNIIANTGRYEKLFSQAIDESLPEPSADIEQVRERLW